MAYWTDQYYGNLYHEIYSQFLLEPQRALDEAAFAAQVLDLGRRTVLDLACGYGRHSRLLAASNRVYALDNNADYLRAMKQDLSERAAKNTLPLCADMRQIPLASASVDAVITLFNSFGYFDASEVKVDAGPAEKGTKGQVWKLPNVFYERQLVDPGFGKFRDPEPVKEKNSTDEGSAATQRVETENLQVLKEVRRVLKPGGGFLLEVANKRPLLEAIEENPRRLMIMENYEVHEEFEWNAADSRLLNRTRFVKSDGAEEAATYSLRLYEPAELKELLAMAGFKVRRMFGDYSGDRFRPAASDLLILHATRPRR